ncbi:hypothetical protein BOTCAL_0139g00150 [Botryotinia calthae]|uniref:Uncharacterized protein n=1 Tax=Botryotinia calthae TaxID=38488 RepID=A0A4Y8D3C0_9HELO|nr:hypothetical protein BOTCAL_0139g00150 [Botryotinia calthae]
MSEESHRPKMTQAEIDLLWAIFENVPKEQINSCVVGTLEAVAAQLGIRKTAAEKRWSRLSIRVRKGKEVADKGAVARVTEETETKASSEDDEAVTKNVGGKDLTQDAADEKAITTAIGVKPKRNNKASVKDKVSQDKVIKKKATVTKGKRGNRSIKDEADVKSNVKEE